MISSIQILIYSLFVFLGSAGVITNSFKKKLIFLNISTFSAVALSFAQMTAHGLMGGVFQIVFRIVSLFFLDLLFFSIGKRNAVAESSDMDGIGRKMPCLFLLLVVLSLLVVGIPMTGTFSGILYSEIGLFGDGTNFGVFTYIGIAGNAFGSIITGLLLFPILRQAYFPEKDALEKRVFVRPGKGLVVCSLVAGLLLTVLSIYQKPVLILAQKMMEMILD